MWVVISLSVKMVNPFHIQQKVTNLWALSFIISNNLTLTLFQHLKQNIFVYATINITLGLLRDIFLRHCMVCDKKFTTIYVFTPHVSVLGILCLVLCNFVFDDLILGPAADLVHSASVLLLLSVTVQTWYRVKERVLQFSCIILGIFTGFILQSSYFMLFSLCNYIKISHVKLFMAYDS